MTCLGITRLARALGAGAIVLFANMSGAASAQDVASFYKGKTLTVQVGASAGGGASDYAQVLARHMGKYLPGQPNMIVQFVPGAGGLLLANNLYNVVPKDGLTFGITTRTFVVANLLGNPNARYDARKFSWLGSSATEYSTCFSWNPTPIKTLDDLRKQEMIVGAAGLDGTAAIFARLANQLADTKMKTITGYPGSTEVILALERGEINGYCGLGWNYIKQRKPDWISEKKVNLLFQMGPDKHPDLPDVPFLSDEAKSPEDRQVFDFFLRPQSLGRPFFGPPDLPAERLAALRAAFEKVLQDPGYLAEAKKMNLDVGYVGGDAAQKLVNDLYALSPAAITRAEKILK